MIDDNAYVLRRLVLPAFTNPRASVLLTGITGGMASDPVTPHWTKLYAAARVKVHPSFRLQYKRAGTTAGGWLVHFTFHREGSHEGVVFVAREELA